MSFTRQIFVLALASAMSMPLARAQFSTGSTGADGAYNPTASGDFDPAALGLNASGDNVFNFTTINIPAGVTIKLRASKLRNKSVTWLATGNVTIAGTLDLSGATPVTLNTDNPAQLSSNRVLPESGPGGYPGGLGSRAGVAPQAGAGPGGGPAGVSTNGLGFCLGGNASYVSSAVRYYNQTTGVTYGTFLLVPLYGGSGGGGGWAATGTGGTGGAGGGAIRIASNTQISVTGTINASGGTTGDVNGTTAGCQGGAGSGGAVHLIAPAIIGNGAITANSGTAVGIAPVYTGLIRFSTNANSYTGPAASSVVLGPLYLPPANSTLAMPSLVITQINGVAVPPTAAGLYLNPDVIISATGAVNVNLAAANIPLGTITTLRITAETGADTTINCAPLAGTLAASTATCSATFPFSISIAGVRATW